MRIRNKAEMYSLLHAGLLGNRFRIWDSETGLLRAVREGFNWLVGVRYVGVPGLPYYHHLTPHDAIALVKRLDVRYPVRYYEASPDQFITIQGEISEYDHGYAVEWSTVRTHMRAALAQEHFSNFSHRIPAIVREHFNEPSYQDLLWLFDTYPGCTVEFTCYETLVGELRGRNTVVWEVRHY